MIGVDVMTGVFDGWPPLLMDALGVLIVLSMFGFSILFALNFSFSGWLRSIFAPANQGCPCSRDPPERSCRGGKD